MRLGVLFSGGKDSVAALWIAQQYGHEIACLLTLESENPASYMFHTPNISLTTLQAKAAGLPILIRKTKGEKEKEVEDLRIILADAKREFGIEGIVTGAIESVYQAARIQRAAVEAGLWVFNPFWKRDQSEHLRELIDAGFEIVISGVAAYPLDARWLGRPIDAETLAKLEEYRTHYGLSPAGEGGELETLVLWAPGWSERLVVKRAEPEYENYAGVWHVKEVTLEKVQGRGRQPTSVKRTDSAVDRGLVCRCSTNPGAGATMSLTGMSTSAATERSEPAAATKEKEILIVSLCAEPLSEREFVFPIIRAIGHSCSIKHYAKLTKEDLSRAKKIILSGTPLADNAFLKNDFSWLRKTKSPVLGICAGMQAIAKEHGATIEKNQEIGMTWIKAGDDAQTVSGEFDAYTLHTFAPTLPDGFKEIARSETCLQTFSHKNLLGVLFHPEVRNWEIIKGFVAERTSNRNENT